jgi:hypothetical protein
LILGYVFALVHFLPSEEEEPVVPPSTSRSAKAKAAKAHVTGASLRA